MKNLTLLYDGNNTAYRANVVSELYTKSGYRTSAIHGVFTSIRSNIEKLEHNMGKTVGEVIIIWDGGRAAWRNALYPEYKGGRIREDDDEQKLWRAEFYEQTNYLHENLYKLGLKSVRFDGWEADDVIYAVTKLCPERQLVIVSSDEDMYQMVDPHVTIYSPIKDITVAADNFEEIVGIPQSSFISYKLLKGDGSDNIKGIDGIGEVTGKDLMRRYGNLQGVLKAQPELMKSKRFARIFSPDGLFILERNSKLMDLSHVDYSEITDELLTCINTSYHIEDKQVMAMLKELEMVSVLMDYKRWIGVYKGANQSERELPATD